MGGLNNLLSIFEQMWSNVGSKPVIYHIGALIPRDQGSRVGSNKTCRHRNSFNIQQKLKQIVMPIIRLQLNHGFYTYGIHSTELTITQFNPPAFPLPPPSPHLYPNHTLPLTCINIRSLQGNSCDIFPSICLISLTLCSFPLSSTKAALEVSAANDLLPTVCREKIKILIKKE